MLHMSRSDNGGSRSGIPHAPRLTYGRVPMTCHTTRTVKKLVKSRAREDGLSDSAWLERAIKHILDNNIAVG